jgi:hypothetical protein
MINTISSRLLFAAISIVLLLTATTVHAQLFWEDSFTQSVVATTEQKDAWTAFKAQLTPDNQYYSIHISGSLDPVGVTCADPAQAAAFANLLNTNTSGIVSCDGHEWALCASRYDGEVWIDPPELCSGSNCPDPGAIIRPGIENSNWGGVGTATCLAPSQTMRLEFNADIEPPKPVPALSTWGVILLTLLLGLGIFRRTRKTA